jgi:hypothetical protein
MLTPEQEEQVREIPQREVQRFARLLAHEIGGTPLRADGNVNVRDFWGALNTAIKMYDAGETA